MKKAIAGTVLTVLTLSLPAMAAVTNKYQFKGNNAYANFYTYDECGYSGVYVSVYNSITKDGPGAPTSQAQANLDYYSYNYCTGVYSSGSGSIQNPNFTIDNQLDSATLKGTFTVYDYSSSTTKTADVDVTWTGLDSSSKGKSTYIYQTPTSITRYRSTGEYRDAKVSGTVTLDGINLIANSSSYGSLSSSTNGTLERTTK